MPVIQGRVLPAGERKLVRLFVWTFACIGLKKKQKCEIELRFWKIDFEYSVLKRVSIFRALFNIPTTLYGFVFSIFCVLFYQVTFSAKQYNCNSCG